MHIIEQLKARRETVGVKQRALARELGMDPAHLSRLENDQLDPRLSTLVELARGLGLELMLVPQDKLPAAKALLSDRSLSEPAYRLGDDDGE